MLKLNLTFDLCVLCFTYVQINIYCVKKASGIYVKMEILGYVRALGVQGICFFFLNEFLFGKLSTSVFAITRNHLEWNVFKIA